jgi:hypothetical protein
MKQTAVDFLAEKYNYITWLRNRDEISAGTADEWRAKFFKEAKEMEKEQIINAVYDGQRTDFYVNYYDSEEYYNEKYNTK